jgi:hypothetical protein
MANRRNLKKDINWLTEEVISDCLIHMDFNKLKDEKPLAEIINTIINKRNELFSRINQPTSNIARGEVKKMYNQMVKEMFETTNDCFEKLSKLPRK